jgi:hypothetical protein
MYLGHSSVEMIGINQKTKTPSMILHLLQSVYGVFVVVVVVVLFVAVLLEIIIMLTYAMFCSAPLCNTVRLMK